MCVHGRKSPWGNDIECISPNYLELHSGSSMSDYNNIFVVVSADDGVFCWISKKCNVIRIEKMLGVKNINV